MSPLRTKNGPVIYCSTFLIAPAVPKRFVFDDVGDFHIEARAVAEIIHDCLRHVACGENTSRIPATYRRSMVRARNGTPMIGTIGLGVP